MINHNWYYSFKNLVLIFILFLPFNSSAQSTKEFSETGKASFYSDWFEDKRTTSGEIFHQNDFTAAHRSLPFGTWVKVVNLDNKKAVIVRINDRGPFVKGRIIDLSKSAAKELGSLNRGVFSVSVQVYQKDIDLIPIQDILNPIPSIPITPKYPPNH